MAEEVFTFPYAGAVLHPTPHPFDPVGKLAAKFAADHAGEVDALGHPITMPPDHVDPVVPDPEPEPEVVQVAPPEETPAEDPPVEDPEV